LLREVLRRPADDAELSAAVNALDESPHVRVLAEEQRSDGSWGRFHTRDYSRKQKIGTTEAGIRRAVELGLPRDHPVLRAARPYLEGILRGRIRFPDRAEKHQNWATGVAMFTAGLLSRFAPEARALDRTWQFWSQVVQRSFARGRYDLDAELRAHQELLGRSGDPTWLRLNSKHVLIILGSRAERLPPAIERGYVRWLWEDCPKGLIYFDVPFDQRPQQLRGFRLHGWLASLELMSAFPSSRKIAEPAIERLLAARDAEGMWDFGTQPSCPRFSRDYRNPRRRAHDWTMRVACLLSSLLTARRTSPASRHARGRGER
jgi:hypothetical protein